MSKPSDSAPSQSIKERDSEDERDGRDERDEQLSLSEFWDAKGSDYDPSELFGEADESHEMPTWNPRVEPSDSVERTTSPLSRADSSGKVVLTFVYPMELSQQAQAHLEGYISEAQSIRRHAANVMRSFDPDTWGSHSPIYNVLKGTWDGSRTSLVSGNVSENMNKVGEAFAAWESNGYREDGAAPPQYGSEPYVAVRSDGVKDVWRTDGGRYGVTVQLGKTRGDVHDSGRKHTFDILLDCGSHQLKAIDAAYEGAIDTGRAEIHKCDGSWFYHQTISYKQPVYDWKDVDRWIGIDLGTTSLYSLAVVERSDESPKGNGIDVLETRHGPGDELMHERRQQEASLAYLQEEYGYAVASEKLGSRLSRHCIDLEHRYANEIVATVRESDPCGLVFEDLIGIKGLGWSNLWSYHRFKQVVTYKAHQAGIPVLTLTKGQTQGTSQECSACGHNPHYDPDGDGSETIPEKEGIAGRIARGQYHCKECGYGPVDADVNAAINIALRLLREG